ncbi:hypothetical protein HYPSUDRAFT_193732 [Hypholoma sublateritium FD-334 SS-4]|uniref:Tyrosinase C-terminal domain-containing protein n=1 Tax=Hypholoma sublateritium (strain FD-334 SS-4) TaxID=945553 RepID=A0A0D2NA56_HYPSF|nr:hypothetical protein HYPSUDRAFT_193732 [Hypholoma sublateritium FD-334 SS-4]
MSHTTTNKNLWEWTARIRSRQCELGSTYMVIVFLGNVPKDPEEWLSCPEFVGKHSVLVSGRKYTRQNQGDDTTEGFVHLTNAIIKRSRLESLDPKDVAPYLKENLNWGVQKADGSVQDLKSLEIVVFGTVMTYPPGGMFPVPGERQRFDSITYGRPGGSRESSNFE